MSSDPPISDPGAHDPERAGQVPAETDWLRAAARGERAGNSTRPGADSWDDDTDLNPGDRVGPFAVLDLIGHGGMGSVYLAEQREPVRRRVALKMIKLGMDTKAVLARFEAERQALAMMDHSHIAKVLEAGVAPKGRPYFAMEYVKGVPITRYCDENKLSLEDRLALFRQVCSGVQHAHTKGVIHRDLTPNNVLVTLQDGKPAAKIIDFGLARATDHRLTEKTLFTERGVILGTPEYMSPEQAGLNALDVDMRSDVYTLGVLLYELLTGKLPFEGAELRAQGLDAMCQTIREVDPPRPSTRVTTQAGGTAAAAKLRRTDASTLLKRLRGDLDWIVLKCLEKDRSRRYETVSHLADDVNRFLDSEPVLARAPSPAYRLAKFARRYRGQLAALAAVFVALVGGLAAALGFWRQAETARAGEAAKAREAAAIAAEALARKREFDQLAVVVHLERLQKALEDLARPWQDLTAAQQWLADADRLLALRPGLERTLASLRSRALPATPEQVEADRRAHPRFAEWQRLQRKLGRLNVLRAGPDWSPWRLPELQSAANTLLLGLDFDGNCRGMRGESPLESQEIRFVPGISGQAAVFGEASRLTFPAASSIDPREGSLALWICPDWPELDGAHYWMRLGAAGGMGMGRDAGGELQFIMDSDPSPLNERRIGYSVAAWRPGEWHHLVFTWSNRHHQMHLYVDGDRVGSTAFSRDLPTVAADVLHVGCGYLAPLDGTLDVLRVHARPLTPEEVECIFDGRPMSKADFDRLVTEHAQLTRMVEERRTFVFPRDGDGEALAFLHVALSGVVARLESVQMTSRVSVAQRLRCAELTNSHPKARVTWQQAAEAIATADDNVASALYRERPIKLRPHLGLVPIGMNPVTKLWEFYELRSAWDPARVVDPAELPIPAHDAEGRIEVDDDTGIVLVLLPGGTFMMGAQKEDKDRPNYDPQATSDEGPPHRVTLSPFFLARHELTQGQWRRLGGRPGFPDTVGDSFAIGDVSWSISQAALRASGLVLPTEAQWEYGCRGGTMRPWWTGADEKSLEGELGNNRPVGRGRSNAFGLFDVAGGVWEWCLDAYHPYSGDAVDPCFLSGSQRVKRGGCWYDSAQNGRSSRRSTEAPANAFDNIGFRPALAARSDVK